MSHAATGTQKSGLSNRSKIKNLELLLPDGGVKLVLSTVSERDDRAIQVPKLCWGGALLRRGRRAWTGVEGTRRPQEAGG